MVVMFRTGNTKMKQPIFIDLQGFKHNVNNFVLKEICIINNTKIFHSFVKSPYKWNELEEKYKRQAIWLKRNHHGFSWNDGYMNLSYVKNQIYMLSQEEMIIYVKGEEKVTWLKSICPSINNIINIEKLDLSLHSYKLDIRDHCNFHNPFLHCAYQNAMSMKKTWDMSQKL